MSWGLVAITLATAPIGNGCDRKKSVWAFSYIESPINGCFFLYQPERVGRMELCSSVERMSSRQKVPSSNPLTRTPSPLAEPMDISIVITSDCDRDPGPVALGECHGNLPDLLPRQGLDLQCQR